MRFSHNIMVKFIKINNNYDVILYKIISKKFKKQIHNNNYKCVEININFYINYTRVVKT